MRIKEQETHPTLQEHDDDDDDDELVGYSNYLRGGHYFWVELFKDLIFQVSDRGSYNVFSYQLLFRLAAIAVE